MRRFLFLAGLVSLGFGGCSSSDDDSPRSTGGTTDETSPIPPGNPGSEGGGLVAIQDCADGLQNGNETAVDCGGSCRPCLNAAPCNVDGDCISSFCDGICRGWATGFSSESTTVVVRDVAVSPVDASLYAAATHNGRIDLDGQIVETDNGDPDPANHDNWLVVKTDPGGAVQWAVSLGGSGVDRAIAVGVDEAGRVDVMGTCRAGFVAGSEVEADGDHLCLLELDPEDGAVLWGRTFLSGDVSPTAMWVDPVGGDIFVVGSARTRIELSNALSPTGADGFVARLSGTDGRSLDSAFFTGSGDDEPRNIAVEGDVLAVVGSTTSATMTVGGVPLGRIAGDPGDDRDGWVVRMDRALTPTAQARFGTAETEVTAVAGVAVGRDGSVFIAGMTDTDHLPVAGAGLEDDRFEGTRTIAARLFSEGEAEDWSRALGTVGDNDVFAGEVRGHPLTGAIFVTASIAGEGIDIDGLSYTKTNAPRDGIAVSFNPITGDAVSIFGAVGSLVEAESTGQPDLVFTPFGGGIMSGTVVAPGGVRGGQVFVPASSETVPDGFLKGFGSR
ncbi:MAG: hypothetical protein AAGA56_17235, partial [Myxococcota bacterium]